MAGWQQSLQKGKGTAAERVSLDKSNRHGGLERLQSDSVKAHFPPTEGRCHHF